MEFSERFLVTYLIFGTQQEALNKAKDICVEQTIEFPINLLPSGAIKEHIVGQIESIEPWEKYYKVKISYANETAANELTQLLNVIFGNISIKPGIKVENIDLPSSFLNLWNGPRFGKNGVRRLLNVPERPLLFTALKPLGLSAQQLANLAYQFAIGGIDIIKDDHGITNQCFASFAERTRLCAEAVRKANKETGHNSIYVANVTTGAGSIIERARQAKEAGAGGILVAPGLVGFDTMRYLADDATIALPIFSHPAFLGSYVIDRNSGFSHQALFGQLMRLAGADAVIYPNFGGRFSFSQNECESIAAATHADMGDIKSIFPAPGGGMSIDSIPKMYQVYGNDVMFLIGGGLFQHGPNLVENCRYFRNLLNGFL